MLAVDGHDLAAQLQWDSSGAPVIGWVWRLGRGEDPVIGSV
jgi:hypothetical protein